MGSTFEVASYGENSWLEKKQILCLVVIDSMGTLSVFFLNALLPV